MHARKEVYNLVQTEMQNQDKIALEAGKSKLCHILADALYIKACQGDGHTTGMDATTSPMRTTGLTT